MSESFLSLKQGQDYYKSTVKIIIDFIIGAKFGFLIFGISAWHFVELMLVFSLALLVVSAIMLVYGRKWIGYGIIAGLLSQFLFAVSLGAV